MKLSVSLLFSRSYQWTNEQTKTVLLKKEKIRRLEGKKLYASDTLKFRKNRHKLRRDLHTKGEGGRGNDDGYGNTQHTQTLYYWETESAGGPVDLPGNIPAVPDMNGGVHRPQPTSLPLHKENTLVWHFVQCNHIRASRIVAAVTSHQNTSREDERTFTYRRHDDTRRRYCHYQNLHWIIRESPFTRIDSERSKLEIVKELESRKVQLSMPQTRRESSFT